VLAIIATTQVNYTQIRYAPKLLIVERETDLIIKPIKAKLRVGPAVTSEGTVDKRPKWFF